MSGCLIFNIKMFYPIFDFFGQFVFGCSRIQKKALISECVIHIFTMFVQLICLPPNMELRNLVTVFQTIPKMISTKPCTAVDFKAIGYRK